jgi:hypothetical protein
VESGELEGADVFFVLHSSLSTLHYSTGRRVDADPKARGFARYFPCLGPGDYGRDRDGNWYCRVPHPDRGLWLGGSIGEAHAVEEYRDRTISVTPAIDIRRATGCWRGHLIRGVWIESSWTLGSCDG